MDSCIVCNQIVRPRQEALLCDGCERWQHRACQTGISGSTWRPTDWTCYKQAIRTNNDIEGWHHGLNRRASGRTQLLLYLLIQLLYREARLTAIQIRLVSEKKLRRIQRRKYRELQQRIFELWDQYEAGERSARRLLKACSYLNGPVEI